MVTVSVVTIELGLAMVAVSDLAPIRPVSLTPLPVKLATPSTASMLIEPPMATVVAPLADNVTVWLDCEPEVTTLLSWS